MTLFFIFERKVTKKFLYLHRIYVLIKIKRAKLAQKVHLYRGCHFRDCKMQITIQSINIRLTLNLKDYGIY